MNSKLLVFSSGLLLGCGLSLGYFCSAASKQESISPSLAAFCSGGESDVLWCRMDFVNLAIHRSQLQAPRLYILGYLAVDDRQVSLFATKRDYEMMERGRSLEIRAPFPDLQKMVESHGYAYVRIEGSFEVDAKSEKAGRLGVLKPPLTLKAVLPRSANPSIGVDVEFLGEDGSR